jgi:DNA polymerase III epsilon subunit-like protein
MDPRASEATGLTDDMLRDAPAFDKAWADLCAFVSIQVPCRVDGATVDLVWTGYNNHAFDDRVLQRELSASGQDLPTGLSNMLTARHRSTDLFVGVKACRTHTLRGMRSAKLTDCYAFHAFDEPFPVNEGSGRAAHDALSDARATRFVWLRTEPVVRKASGQRAMMIMTC